MEILGSTQYVDLEKQKEQWYQLSVINQWDWSTKAVCFSNVGNTLISYCINLCTPISNDRYRIEKIEELTDEMKDFLLSKGYSVK